MLIFRCDRCGKEHVLLGDMPFSSKVPEEAAPVAETPTTPQWHTHAMRPGGMPAPPSAPDWSPPIPPVIKP